MPDSAPPAAQSVPGLVEMPPAAELPASAGTLPATGAGLSAPTFAVVFVGTGLGLLALVRWWPRRRRPA